MHVEHIPFLVAIGRAKSNDGSVVGEGVNVGEESIATSSQVCGETNSSTGGRDYIYIFVKKVVQ